MLIWGTVGRLARPTRHEERMHLQCWITEWHRERCGSVRSDAELLETLPDDRLLRQFARFDMSADEVPTVGVPPTERMSVCEKHLAIANQYGNGDRRPQAHPSTLCRASHDPAPMLVKRTPRKLPL